MRRVCVIFCVLLTAGCARGEEPYVTVAPRADEGFDVGVAAEGDRLSPETCEQAAAARSYIGCDFWPTVVANDVWSIFDFAVIVANAGSVDAEVTVTWGAGERHATVRAGELSKIYLPWQPELKGPDADECGTPAPMTASVLARGGAYHLTSTRPVSVVQFNALEYSDAGGPEDKSWDACPGSQMCEVNGGPVGCLSFSNDASLLLPTSALTGHVRVASVRGWSEPDATNGSVRHVTGAYFAITATEDGTHVHVKTSARGAILAGKGVPAVAAGGSLSLTLNAGDVAELVSPADEAADPSGGWVSADRPVQVIGGAPCVPMPIGQGSCDHVEEAIPPAEALGKDYVVTVPTAPSGQPFAHVVRLIGNVDGTHLVWSPTKPEGAPSTIDAGEVIEIAMVREDVRVTGDHEFVLSSFMLSGELVDTSGRGDPSMSMITPIEQYRRRYVFLAPDDYSTSFVDVVLPSGATLELDGVPHMVDATPLGKTGYSVLRLPLDGFRGGAHELVATAPVGIQVLGYGAFTSHQYPGGLDLRPIAAAR